MEVFDVTAKGVSHKLLSLIGNGYDYKQSQFYKVLSVREVKFPSFSSGPAYSLDK